MFWLNVPCKNFLAIFWTYPDWISFWVYMLLDWTLLLEPSNCVFSIVQLDCFAVIDPENSRSLTNSVAASVVSPSGCWYQGEQLSSTQKRVVTLLYVAVEKPQNNVYDFAWFSLKAVSKTISCLFYGFENVFTQRYLLETSPWKPIWNAIFSRTFSSFITFCFLRV